MGKTRDRLVVTISILLIIWFFACIFDVNLHNMTDRAYAPWNMLVEFVRWFA